jgi:spore maturation protein CgeB
MIVGVIGPTGFDRFADNIADALRCMGHRVAQLGPAHLSYGNRHVSNVAMLALQAMPSLDERAQQRIVRSALDAGCEVVINVDLRLAPDAVARLRRAGTRVAFWFPDAVSQLGRQLMVLAPYDAVFFKEPYLVDRFRVNLDMPVYYLPEACNPRWHRPLLSAGTEPCLVVVGNMYPTRVRLLERLVAKGIPLKLYGPGIPRWIGETPVRELHAGRSIFCEEKARVFRSAAGVLNTMHPAEVRGVNARLFEAAGSGGAVLSEFRQSLPELFGISEELLTFNDFDELIDQATRLLNEVGLAARLGDAAARRAHRDHTYERRLTTILEKVS